MSYVWYYVMFFLGCFLVGVGAGSRLRDILATTCGIMLMVLSISKAFL